MLLIRVCRVMLVTLARALNRERREDTEREQLSVAWERGGGLSLLDLLCSKEARLTTSLFRTSLSAHLSLPSLFL